MFTVPSNLRSKFSVEYPKCCSYENVVGQEQLGLKVKYETQPGACCTKQNYNKFH